MKLTYPLWVILFTASTVVSLAQSVSAESLEKDKSKLNTFSNLKELKLPVRKSAPLLVQEFGRLGLIEITGVRLTSTDTGVEVILQTSAANKLQVVNRSEGNNFIADISGAQLRLSTGDQFTQDKPVEGIASVTLTKQDDNTVRLTVTGEASMPKVELFDSKQGLIFALTPSTSAAQAAQKPIQQPQQEATPQQPIENPPQPSPESNNDQPIELIVTGERDGYKIPNATTGTRTDSPISDIPQSIQVVPQQVIEDKQATSVEETVDNVSGVTYLGKRDGRSANFAIRGFENAPILRDGIRNYSVLQGIPEVANLDRVEVLKGPASVLYGDIQPGGLINLVTKKPLAEPFYEGQLQVGNRSFFQPSFDISGPLTADGELLYRLNALYRNEDSFRNYDTSFNRFFIAPSVTWQAGKNTDITFNLEYSKDDNPADFGTLAFGNGIADIPPERVTNNPEDTIDNRELNVGYSLEHRFNDNWKLKNRFSYINFKYDYGVLALPFRFNEEAGILTRIWSSQSQEQDNFSINTNVEGKFNTGSIRHNLLFGVDLSRNEVDSVGRFARTIPPTNINIFDPDYSADPRPDLEDIGIFSDSRIKGDRLGIYLQDQVYFSDNLILLAGLRYDTIEQIRTDNIAEEEATQNDDSLTPRIGFVYKPIDTVSLYASYSRSFNPNDETTADGDFLEPEESEGFEVGVKTELIKDKLSATLAYFDITKQNVAIPDPILPNFSIASGEQKSRGVELDVVGEISPGLKVIASYAYTDAEITEDNNPENVGNELPGVPEHRASLWTTYEVQKGNLQGLGFGIGLKYVGARKGDLDNSFEVEDYLTTDAAIFYQRNNWRAALNFKNIFDLDYIEGVGISRIRGIYPGKPFTILGSISVKF
ncbi:TonB-dependent siderophore receptor [Rivularia sp. PCC 7116]|uniref:TonB-dependent receptor n=1 Tax=Rivularia sp. PCC 7116 TaxID=373994 RepID=UPI00029ECDA1|nr:TonB-dependent receptor [Rivularia sp. PCC 7116]AFY58529.1 TonB-dependent siderophore receptor [Rivularia sp. PCC 7116]